MISEMKGTQGDYIKSAANMLTICANYLYVNSIIQDNPNLLVYQINEYINNHIGDELSVDLLCKAFFISKTKLYKLSLKNYNMGISDYIRHQRIKFAKKLLRNTEDSVASIGLRVGIKDANYFIRIFKQIEGITPLQYRKSIMKDKD